MIINIMVFFFNGLSVGCGVVISSHFGAKDLEKLHRSIETTMALTFVLSILFTIIGVLWVRPMLIFMKTPLDVVPEATVYLRIYFAGIAGLLIYNMASGVLRAVGDTTRPLYFLVFTSVLNIILDFFFVLVLGRGIDGVAYATIISQMISAVLVIRLLTRTRDIYRMTWTDLHIDRGILKSILSVGLPTAVQSTITSFSNVFVQSYVNFFGSSVMAGWSCFNKLDQFVFLPMNSFSNAATTFVSQNMGAKEGKRASKGTIEILVLSVLVTGTVALSILIFAVPASAIFTNDSEVIRYSAMFIHMGVPFIVFNCVNHTLAGALRGYGDSKAPMYIMLGCFVVLRQIYLYVGTHFFVNSVSVIGYAYPVGWTSCCIIEVIYFLVRWRNPSRR